MGNSRGAEMIHGGLAQVFRIPQKHSAEHTGGSFGQRSENAPYDKGLDLHGKVSYASGPLGYFGRVVRIAVGSGFDPVGAQGSRTVVAGIAAGLVKGYEAGQTLSLGGKNFSGTFCNVSDG